MLLYFILGVLFIAIVIPIIESLTSIISSWTEYVICKYAVKIYELKSLIHSDDEEEGEQVPLGFRSTVVQGFEIDTEGQDDEEDNE